MKVSRVLVVAEAACTIPCAYREFALDGIALYRIMNDVFLVDMSVSAFQQGGK